MNETKVPEGKGLSQSSEPIELKHVIDPTLNPLALHETCLDGVVELYIFPILQMNTCYWEGKFKRKSTYTLDTFYFYLKNYNTIRLKSLSWSL